MRGEGGGGGGGGGGGRGDERGLWRRLSWLCFPLV